MATKYKIPKKVQDILNQMDRYIDFQKAQGRQTSRVGLTAAQYRIVREHFNSSYYRNIEIYTVEG